MNPNHKDTKVFSGYSLCPLRLCGEFRNGSVLVVTIWVVAILVILTVSLTGLTSERILFSKQYRRQTQAYFIARSGITQALAELKRDAKSSGYDGLNETWANSPEVFQERKVGDGYFSVSHPVNREGITGTAETVLLYGLVDEERKINLNSAPPQHLINLFEEQAGLTPSESKSIANCIIDWRDAGDEPREDGAENSFYQSRPNSYACKNDKFEVLEELLLVKGMTSEIFNKVKDYLTVCGEGKVNINTASLAALKAIGLDEGLANKILRFRSGKDRTEGTDDDSAFTATNSIVNQLNQVEALSQEESQQLNNLVVTNAVATKSEYFRVESTGYLGAPASSQEDTGQKAPENTKTITCIIKRNGRIVFWQE